MNESSPTPALATRPDNDEVTIERADLVVDTTFAMEEIDDAIDVVFAAIKGAQRSLHSIPDNASPIEIRNEWRLHNVLVRQAIRLIDEAGPGTHQGHQATGPCQLTPSNLDRTPARPWAGVLAFPASAPVCRGMRRLC
jgi:hypothetical protein